MSPLWLVPLVLIVSVLGCGIYLQAARRWQLVDHPNERSSHRLPTPHGGGLPLIASFALGVLGGCLLEVPWSIPLLISVGMALLLSLLGMLDDLLDLPVRLRFALYAACAVTAVWLVADVGVNLWRLPLFVLGLLWLLNLYNFMDGTDGLAATQCVLACVVAALLAWLGGGWAYALLCLLLAAAQFGFLCWNLPPARLFMGDAGSVPTGFMLGVFALAGEAQGSLPLVCWLILLAPFITDGTWTLLQRLLRGEDITQPHRKHLYQRLSRYWGSHRAVMMALLAVLSLWLFPLAWAAQTFQGLQLFLVILAYLPLLICMAKTGNIA